MPIRHSLCVFQVKTTTLCLPSFRVASQMLTNTQLFLSVINWWKTTRALWIFKWYCFGLDCWSTKNKNQHEMSENYTNEFRVKYNVIRILFIRSHHSVYVFLLEQTVFIAWNLVDFLSNYLVLKFHQSEVKELKPNHLLINREKWESWGRPVTFITNLASNLSGVAVALFLTLYSEQNQQRCLQFTFQVFQVTIL